ncbi:uncharacterized protein LOC128681480 [Plodia interpunctella]|uniref:uncharacterized protein LOC128681480 n=1 Tax=Plodia interpunctella TaxID=58824 RepID=UPI002368C995|nr:uncharacterized protein LOC128681480 [Plodia interpunctella]
MVHLTLFTILSIAMPLIAPAILPKAIPMGALLQNILNPANSERAKQILQLTGAVNKVPTSPVMNLLQEVSAPRTKQLLMQDVQRPVAAQQEIIPFTPCAARPVIQDRLVYPYSTPVPLVNPFLPAASPVSAIAPPTSTLLPPVDPTQVRSHFLRKIPIPPPSL